MTTDAILAQAIDLLSDGDDGAAEEVLAAAVAASPGEARLLLVLAVAVRAQGRRSDAFAILWRTLAADPQAAGARVALVESVVDRHAPPPDGRDFSLASGERQTASAVADIRPDHRARYAFAAQWVRRHLAPARLRTGLDAFCGNGYGSRMIADLAGARMIGLDGSAEAVAQAERVYASHRVAFGQAAFPFSLTPSLFEFAVCFESIEHVDDPAALLRELAAAAGGPLFISAPLEDGLPYRINRDRFRHHVRHFRREELSALLAEAGWPVLRQEWGQVVYRTEAGRVQGLLGPDDMGLGPLDSASQFWVAVAARRD